jgi:predicted ester cyclase
MVPERISRESVQEEDMKSRIAALGLFAALALWQSAPAIGAQADNKAVVRRLVEGFNAGKSAVYEELLAPSFVAHGPAPGTDTNRDQHKESMARLRTAFPDARVTIVEMLVDGDKVILRHTLSGTHTGKLQSPSLGEIAATGKRMAITGIVIYRVAGGKITDRWSNMDDLGMLVQLGIITLPLRAPR